MSFKTHYFVLFFLILSYVKLIFITGDLKGGSLNISNSGSNGCQVSVANGRLKGYNDRGNFLFDIKRMSRDSRRAREDVDDLEDDMDNSGYDVERTRRQNRKSHYSARRDRRFSNDLNDDVEYGRRSLRKESYSLRRESRNLNRNVNSLNRKADGLLEESNDLANAVDYDEPCRYNRRGRGRGRRNKWRRKRGGLFVGDRY